MRLLLVFLGSLIFLSCSEEFGPQEVGTEPLMVTDTMSNTETDSNTNTTTESITDTQTITEQLTETATLIETITTTDSMTATDTSISSTLPSAEFNLQWTAQNIVQVTPNEATSNMGLVFQWDFGDQSLIDTSVNPSHTYDKVGEFTITLIISNANGLSATSSQVILFENTQPVANFLARYEPLKATFDARLSEDDAELTYQWHILDDELSGQSVEYLFDQTGEFTVELTVTDLFGQTHSTTKQITITEDANIEPAMFIASQQDNHLAQLIATNSYDLDSDFLTYEWLINGEVHTAPKLYYQFPYAGDFVVKLTGFDGEAYVSVEQTFTVTDPEPVHDYDLTLYQVSIEIIGRCTSCHDDGALSFSSQRDLDLLANDLKDYISLRSALLLISFPSETNGLTHSGYRFIAGQDRFVDAGVRVNEAELVRWTDLILMLEQDL